MQLRHRRLPKVQKQSRRLRRLRLLFMLAFPCRYWYSLLLSAQPFTVWKSEVYFLYIINLCLPKYWWSFIIIEGKKTVTKVAKGTVTKVTKGKESKKGIYLNQYGKWKIIINITFVYFSGEKGWRFNALVQRSSVVFAVCTQRWRKNTGNFLNLNYLLMINSWDLFLRIKLKGTKMVGTGKNVKLSRSFLYLRELVWIIYVAFVLQKIYPEYNYVIMIYCKIKM